ncbi:MAG TPA: rhomboid family intramembrane serine protease [Ramlibacter sp.]|nr:rhomboid family intramembrane serine protease [Ramlibacter sp.]
MFSLPRITRTIIIANVALFILDSALGGAWSGWLALWPLGSGNFMPWQVLTYAFVHGSVAHVGFNMLGVYMFGADLERVWGERRYLTYYLFCAVSAAAVQLVISAFGANYGPTIGASGAVFGLLLGYARLFPHRMIMPLFPPIPMRAPVFVVLYGVLELFLGVTGTQAGVAHFAHLGGLAGGFFLMRYWKQWR